MWPGLSCTRPSSPLQEADCVVVSVFRVMLDVLEDQVPLAHLERLDLR